MRRAIILLLTLLTCTACTSQQAAKQQDRPVIILVDRSGSTETVAEAYQAQVQKVIDSLQGGEHLLILPIASDSLTAAAAVDIRFPAYRRFTTNTFTQNRTMKKLKQQAAAESATLIQQPRATAAQHTALIDGLLQASDLLGGQPGTICIISDMVEDSDLAAFESLTEPAIPQILTKTESANRLPRFPAETRIHVAGLSAAGQMEPARVLAIRRFWEQFFAKAGASLVEYGPEFHNL